ncbi:MAG: bifunctional hydroxymethylpyrimidine kinase/phosphomethylpyrimidine kinase [Kiritimatiellae bacterium]|nr:bifunctional hydroxymethylpyrimidine kinase/phosphomethylpyrimidine kinase [Kiritimatiellia bacterium]
MKRLLTIQDISCVGQCSTTVALPIVSACGIECSVLPPAILSNHTGFRTWSFRDLTDELPKVEAKWVEQGIRFDAFYTGYVCESHIGPILSVMKSCSNPGAVRIVDPAMADNGVLYPGFGADFPGKIARLVSGADYVLPNLTEAALLTGEDPLMFVSGDGRTRATREGIERLIGRLHGMGAKNVVITGIGLRPDELGTATSDGHSVVYDFNPRIDRLSHGTGDIFASVFVGAVLRGMAPSDAAALAADFVCAAIGVTPPDHTYSVCFELVLPQLIGSLASVR